MNWYRVISYLINAVIAVAIIQSIYKELTDLSVLKTWGLSLATFLGIYYSCKQAIDDTRSDTK